MSPKTPPAGALIAVDKNTSTGGKSLPDPSPGGEEMLLDLHRGLVRDLKVEQRDPNPLKLKSIGPHLELYTTESLESFIQCGQRSRAKFLELYADKFYPIMLVVSTGSVE